MNPVIARNNVRVVVRPRTGPVQIRETHNIVTDDGLDLIRDLATLGSGATGISHVGFGDGGNPPDAGDSVLQNEHTDLRTVISTAEHRSNELVISGYLTESDGAGKRLSEIGLFTAATAGVLYARALINPAIEKTNGEAVSVIWTLTWTRP